MTKIKRRNLLTEMGLVKLGAVLSPRFASTQAINPQKEAKVLTARLKHQFATTWCTASQYLELITAPFPAILRCSLSP